jgi:hypothetical protein
MPSAGTTMRSFRFNEAFWEMVEETVERRNTWSMRPPWTLSQFVRIAIVEKIKKMERSRNWRPGQRSAAAAAELVEHDQAVAGARVNG